MTTRRDKPRLTRSADEYFEKRFAKNPKEALVYLNVALEEEEPEVFLLALRDVINAQRRRMADVAAASNVHRVSLQKALSSKGNPRLTTLRQVLASLDLQLAVAPKRKRGTKSA